MEELTLEQKYREYLDTLPLMTLRVLGRNAGASHSSSSPKEELIDALVAIYTGKADPAPRSKRGAPPKQNYVDPAITARLDRIRWEGERRDESKDFLTVSSGEERLSRFEEPVYSGILEIMQGGYGFLRAKNCQPTANGKDVFLAAPAIHSLKLREGDFVTCTALPRQKNDSPALGEVFSVNGLNVGAYEQRLFFDALTAQYAKEKIELSYGDSLSLRVLDLFVPIGKGQRALIIAPPKAGKTTLLKDVAKAIEHNHPELQLFVLLIDERPEEVTDIRGELREAKVIYSTFDEGAERHIRAAQLTIAHAKRLAEQGKDVVILLDSLTKLTRAHNYLTESTGKTLSGGLDAGAFSEPKRFFGAARNTVEAGSITILATVLVDTGSRMDDVIYEEFKGTGNADVFLSRDLAERRIFPAIDVSRSGTRREDLLLLKEEMSAVYKLRERGITGNTAGVLEMLKRTSDNAEFISRLPEWLKIYKNI